MLLQPEADRKVFIEKYFNFKELFRMLALARIDANILPAASDIREREWWANKKKMRSISH